MKRKKNLVVVMISVMVVGLTACNGEADDSKLVESFQTPTESVEKESNDMQGQKVTETQEPQSAASEETQEVQETQEIQEVQETQKVQETQELQKTQEVQESEDEELEENLAKYRAERENATGIPMGNGVTGSGGAKLKPEDYNLLFDASATENFDSRELVEALDTAKNYVENTLEIPIETKYTIYTCVDPRIWEIYEAEDKGVADGYEAENIFVCEYSDNGKWQYLIVVREEKGSAWNVIHHGSSYME